MRLDDRAADRQPHAHAADLGGQEGIEELLALARLDALSSSGDLRAYEFCLRKLVELGPEHMTPPRLSVVGPLRHVRDIQVDDYRYLSSLATQTPKVSIPSPTMVHFRGGRAAIDLGP